MAIQIPTMVSQALGTMMDMAMAIHMEVLIAIHMAVPTRMAVDPVEDTEVAGVLMVVTVKVDIMITIVRTGAVVDIIQTVGVTILIAVVITLTEAEEEEEVVTAARTVAVLTRTEVDHQGG